MADALPGMTRARLEHELASLMLNHLEKLRGATYFTPEESLHAFTWEGRREYRRLLEEAQKVGNKVFGHRRPTDAGFRQFHISHEQWMELHHEMADAILELLGEEEGIEIWKTDPADPAGITYTDDALRMLEDFVEEEVIATIMLLFGSEQEARMRSEKKKRKGIRFWRPEEVE